MEKLKCILDERFDLKIHFIARHPKPRWLDRRPLVKKKLGK